MFYFCHFHFPNFTHAQRFTMSSVLCFPFSVFCLHFFILASIICLLPNVYCLLPTTYSILLTIFHTLPLSNLYLPSQSSVCIALSLEYYLSTPYYLLHTTYYLFLLSSDFSHLNQETPAHTLQKEPYL